MTTAVRTALYPLITAGQSAVRDTERHATPETLRTIDGALCALPVNEMDDQADRILHAAIRAVSLAGDAEEWEALAELERALSQMLHTGDPVTENPAVKSMLLLVSQCSARCGQYDHGDVTRAAWERAFQAGTEALGALLSVLRKEMRGPEMDKRVTAFLTAVRRAIPYAALYETRRALVEAARAYGLFVIGMRQPMPTNGRWGWARRLGRATFLFEVEPPHMEGDPYGAVAVRRIAEDGTAAPVRYIPLGPDEERRRAVTEAQYRI
ncbi:hypothetical protein [Streptomyces sp. NPDC053427]|uniref:hypothetical protein n=1 Tax=Streptomyces sp. NPDC053427 TaxID=3365701 RepID=UPI0037D940A8